jgi:exopolysaccharide biosynthesis protein
VPSQGPHPTTNMALSARKQKREQKQRRRKRLKRWMLGSLLSLAIFVSALVGIGFGTPWGRDVRLTLAETVITTRHGQLAHLLTLPSEYEALKKQLNQVPKQTGIPAYVEVVHKTTSASPIEFEPIAGNGWNGYVMLVHNPKLVRLVAANVHNGMGEYITDMIQRTGAIAGTNASGFDDPHGSSWGGVPVGLVMIGGKVVQWPQAKTASWTTVGFTRDGVMVMGNYSVAQLQRLGVRDAVQFHPELVVNGEPMIKYGDGGWGYGPRTAIGQRKDGTVIFMVINGRFHGGAQMGASQRQVMDEMLKYGAVNACALDGGSSSVMYGNGRILNSPSTLDPNGQRHLPNAWLVFPTEEAANQYGS